jgi:dihydrodipicolinate synthase/N-acetylneuraminate lyase
MELPRLHGIVPPVATPLLPDGSLDVTALENLIEFQIEAGVHGLWILGTTARFDLLGDDTQREIADVAIETAAGRLPMVLNVSDQGTRRTLLHARMFDDLAYDYYAVLPPWYQPMTPGEVMDYFRALADELARPVVIYNAPWVCNQLSFDQLRRLAEHPRIVGCKDVCPSLFRTLDWSVKERRGQDFSYLHGNDLLGLSTDLGADGFVISLANPFPELAVALWEAVRAGNSERAFRLQSQFTRLARLTGFGPNLACLDVACRHRGLLKSMLPRPLRALEADKADAVIEVMDSVGVQPEEGDPSPRSMRPRREKAVT